MWFGETIDLQAQVLDTEHDVVVFEDAFIYRGAPHSDEDAIVMVQDEFEKLAE